MEIQSVKKALKEEIHHRNQQIDALVDILSAVRSMSWCIVRSLRIFF